MKASVSKNIRVFREPINGGWEKVLPYIHQFEEGSVIEEGLRTQIGELAAKWKEASGETSFYVLFQVPEDPEAPAAFSWALRPFLQGMGSDFDSSGPIHLIAKRLCQKVGIDYKVLYHEAYPEEDDIRWIDTLEIDVEDVGQEQALDPVLAVRDLREINNHALVGLLSEEWIERGLLSNSDDLLGNSWNRVRERAGLGPEEPSESTMEELAIAYWRDPNQDRWDRLAGMNTSLGTVWNRYSKKTGKELIGPRFVLGVRVRGWEPLPDPAEVLDALEITPGVDRSSNAELILSPLHQAVLVPVDAIRVIENTRKYIDPERLAGLAADIQTRGLQQPITVAPDGDGTYHLVYGERRFRAHQLLKVDKIAAFVRADLTSEQIRDIRRSENLQRENLSPIDEAEDFERDLKSLSIKEIAERVFHDESYIRDRLSLLSLHDQVRGKLRSGKLNVGIAKILACLPQERQLLLLEKVEAEKLNTRQLSNFLSENNDLDLTRAPFDTQECRQCPHNSAGQPDLFERLASGLGKCLQSPCWRKKEEEKANDLVRFIEEGGPRAVITEKIQIGLGDLPNDVDRSLAVLHNRAEIGEEQIKECASCKFLVVFVSKNGRLLQQKICANKGCYDECADRFREANKKEEKPEIKSKNTKQTGRVKGSAGKSKSAGGAQSRPKKMIPQNAPQRVKDMKRRRYRDYLTQHLVNTPENLVRVVILGLIDTRWNRSWSENPKLKAFSDAVKWSSHCTDKAYPLIHKAGREDLISIAGEIARPVCSHLSLHLEEELLYGNLHLSAEALFSVDKEYLELLTKGEIEDTAKEIGLDRFLQTKGKSLAKLAALTKKEFIKGLLSSGFKADRMPAWLQRETTLEVS